MAIIRWPTELGQAPGNAEGVPPARARSEPPARRSRASGGLGALAALSGCDSETRPTPGKGLDWAPSARLIVRRAGTNSCPWPPTCWARRGRFLRAVEATMRLARPPPTCPRGVAVLPGYKGCPVLVSDPLPPVLPRTSIHPEGPEAALFLPSRAMPVASVTGH